MAPIMRRCYAPELPGMNSQSSTTQRWNWSGSFVFLMLNVSFVGGMGGDLVLDPAEAGRGASFRLTLPGEPAHEA